MNKSYLESIEEEAISWILKSEEGLNQEEKELFAKWMDRSANHEQIFNQMKSVLQKVDSLDDATFTQEKPVNTKNYTYKIAATFIAIFVGIFFLLQENFLQKSSFQTTYKTAQHSIKTFTLPDNSTITLDGNSEVEVAFLDEKRSVTLKKGRAFFDVTKDKNLPFEVVSNLARVTVLGTSFCVNYENKRADIVVKSGKVKVERLLSKAPISIDYGKRFFAKDLKIGERVTLYRDRDAELKVVDLENIALWREGRASFNNNSLEDALYSFRSFNNKEIKFLDSSKNLRVSGSFSLDRFEDFLLMLEKTYPIKIDKKSTEIVIKRRDL